MNKEDYLLFLSKKLNINLSKEHYKQQYRRNEQKCKVIDTFHGAKLIFLGHFLLNLNKIKTTA